MRSPSQTPAGRAEHRVIKSRYSLNELLITFALSLFLFAYLLWQPGYSWSAERMFSVDIEVSSNETRVQVNDQPSAVVRRSRPTDAPLPESRVYSLHGVLAFERAYPGRRRGPEHRGVYSGLSPTQAQRDRASTEYAVALRMWTQPVNMNTMHPEFEWPTHPIVGLREPGPLPIAAKGPGVNGVKPFPQGVVDRALPALAQWVDEQIGIPELADGVRAGGTPQPDVASLTNPPAVFWSVAGGVVLLGIAILRIVQRFFRV